MWGYPLGIYSVPPLGGEPRMVLDDAFGPEPLPDGSLIVVKMTDQGDNQLFHFWPDSGKLEALPAFLQNWSDITPMLRAFPDGKELVYYGTTEKEASIKKYFCPYGQLVWNSADKRLILQNSPAAK